MLLNEWFSWWAAIDHLIAEERLGNYTAMLLADSGWTLDRESLLSAWRQLAAGVVPIIADGVPLNDIEESTDAPGALRRQAWRVWEWLRQSFGSAVD